MKLGVAAVLDGGAVFGGHDDSRPRSILADLIGTRVGCSGSGGRNSIDCSATYGFGSRRSPIGATELLERSHHLNPLLRRPRSSVNATCVRCLRRSSTCRSPDPEPAVAASLDAGEGLACGAFAGLDGVVHPADAYAGVLADEVRVLVRPS
jgi:hypothetical protein